MGCSAASPGRPLPTHTPWGPVSEGLFSRVCVWPPPPPPPGRKSAGQMEMPVN